MLRLSISFDCPEVVYVLCPARILSGGFSCVLRLGTHFKMSVVSMLVFLYTSCNKCTEEMYEQYG